MLIAIDHGNKQIKTAHKTYTAGFCVSDTRPPFGKDVLFYKDRYYTLSDQRIPYMRDKTKDERYFILSLFAIAFELREQGYATNEVADIQLRIGLPPPLRITASSMRASRSIFSTGISWTSSWTASRFPFSSAKQSVSHRRMLLLCRCIRKLPSTPKRLSWILEASQPTIC